MNRLTLWTRAALAVAASVLSTQAGAVALVRQPFLQQVQTQHALVVFRADASCPAAVHFGAGTALDLVAKDANAAAEHAIALDGLSAGTVYAYQVEACGQLLGPVHHFRTASGALATSVHFAAIGDEGTGGSTEAEVGNAILAAHPEFWIGIGDNAYDYGSADDFQANFFQPLAPLNAEVPVFPSTGNHEYVTDNAQPYLDAFYLPADNPAGTERYYSFDWGPVHMVSIDSNCAAGWTTTCDANALKSWLRNDLAATTRPWKVVYLHHPFWSSGLHGSTPAIQSALTSIVEQGNVDLVLQGHDHDYERSKPMLGTQPAQGGITYVVAGTGGAPIREFPVAQPAWSAYRNQTDNGFLDVKIAGGTLTGTFLRTDGQVLDQFTLTKTVATPPAATFTVAAEPASGAAPLRSLLTAQTNVSSPTVSWDFGDGTTGDGMQVAHEFAQPGTYRVTASATSATDGVTLAAGTSVAVGAADCAATHSCPPPPDAGTGGTTTGITGADGGAAQGTQAPGGQPSSCGGGGTLLFPFAAGAALLRRRRRR